MKNTLKLGVIAIALAGMGAAQASENGSFYAEAFGGYADSAFGAPEGVNNAGASYNGQMQSIDQSHNSLFGLRVGYEISSHWRADLSYYDAGNDLAWSTYFPGCCSTEFTADLDSQTLLVSGYYAFSPEGKSSPYIGIGAGVSRNKFSNATESYLGTTFAFPEQDTRQSFAYRVAVGVDYSISDSWKLNMDLSYMDLGKAASGTTRTFTNSSVQSIGRYQFDNIQRAVVTVGLKYSF